MTRVGGRAIEKSTRKALQSERARGGAVTREDLSKALDALPLKVDEKSEGSQETGCGRASSYLSRFLYPPFEDRRNYRNLECRVLSLEQTPPSSSSSKDKDLQDQTLWILFRTQFHPKLLDPEEVVELVDPNDLLSSSTTTFTYNVKPLTSSSCLDHFIKEARKVIKKYNIPLNTSLHNFIVYARSSPSCTIKFIQLEPSRVEKWSLQRSMRSSLRDNSISLKGKKGIFHKLFKQNKKDSRTQLEFIREFTFSRSGSSDLAIDDTLMKQKEEYSLKGTIEEMGANMNCTCSKSNLMQSVSECQFYSSNDSMAKNWVKEIEIIKSSIQDSEVYVLEALAKYIESNNLQEIKEVMQVRTRSMHNAVAKADSVMLDILSQQLNDISSQLSSSQTQIDCLIQKNRKLEIDNVELCKIVCQMEREDGGKVKLEDSKALVIKINEELYQEQISLKSHLEFLEKELSHLNEEISAYRENESLQQHKIEGLKAMQKRMTAEKCINEIALKKEIVFKDNIIADSTEKCILLFKDIRNFTELLKKTCPSLQIGQEEAFVDETSSLIEVITLCEGYISKLQAAIESVPCQMDGYNILEEKLSKLKKGKNRSKVFDASMQGESDSSFPFFSNSEKYPALLPAVYHHSKNKSNCSPKQLKCSWSVLEVKTSTSHTDTIDGSPERINSTLQCQIRELLTEKNQLLEKAFEAEQTNEWYKGKIVQYENQMKETKRCYEIRCMSLQANFTQELNNLNEIHGKLHDQLNRVLSEKDTLVEMMENLKKENELLLKSKTEALKELCSLQEDLGEARRKTTHTFDRWSYGSGDSMQEFGQHQRNFEVIKAKLESDLIDKESSIQAITVKESAARDGAERLKADLEEERREVLHLKNLLREKDTAMVKEKEDKLDLQQKYEEMNLLLKKKTNKVIDLSKELENKSINLRATEEHLMQMTHKLKDLESKVNKLGEVEKDLEEHKELIEGYERHITAMDEDLTQLEEVETRVAMLMDTVQETEQLTIEVQSKDLELEEVLIVLESSSHHLYQKAVSAEASAAASARNVEKTLNDVERFELIIEELQKRLSSKTAEVDEANLNFEKTHSELLVVKRDLEKSQTSNAQLKVALRNQINILMKELNVALEKKLELEKTISELFSHRSSLEIDHEKLCEKLVRAIKMIMDGKLVQSQLKEQGDVYLQQIENLQNERDEAVKKLTLLIQNVNEANETINRLEYEKRQHMDDLKDAIPKRAYNDMVNELRSVLSSLELEMAQEKSNFQQILGQKDRLMDEKEKALETAKIQEWKSKNEVQAMGEQVLRLRQAQHNLQQYISALEGEKKENNYLTKELKNQLHLERKLRAHIGNMSKELIGSVLGGKKEVLQFKICSIPTSTTVSPSGSNAETVEHEEMTLTDQ